MAMYRILADLVLLLHLAFVVFVVFGGLLALRYPRVVWLHLPTLAWGIAIELADGICPLTPLENLLRQRGGEAGYADGFIEHWVSQVVYPEYLTLELRYVLALILAAINVGVYAFLIFRQKLGKTKR